MKKLINFSLVGIISMLVNIGLYALFNSFFHIHYLVSGLLAFIFSASLHFLLQRTVVFKSGRHKDPQSQAVLFLFAVGVNIVLNQIFLYVFVGLLSLWPLIVHIISLGVLAVLNFFLYENIIFNHKNKFISNIHIHFNAHLRKYLTVSLLLVFWLAINAIGILYGTSHLPLHGGYVGDEQSPINGAFHILNEKSLLAVHNLPTLYYGPVFSLIALLPVMADYITSALQGFGLSPVSYLSRIIFNWGGILVYARLVSTLVGFFTLLIVYKIFPKKIAPLATILLGFNYYFFEYTHFFKHWIYLICALVAALYAVQKIHASDDNKRGDKKYWFLLFLSFFFSFGISYVSVIYYVFMLPFIFVWFKHKDFKKIKPALWTAGACLICGVLIVWWHPSAFFRLFAGRAFVTVGYVEMNNWIYYGKLILLNHLAYIVTIAWLTFFAFRNKLIKLKKLDPLLISFILLGIVNYVVFATQARAEGRYMLFSVLAVVLILVYLLSKLWECLPRIQKISITTLITFGLAFHVVSIVGWNITYLPGPADTQAIQNVLEFQRENKNMKILAITDYIFAYPHTKRSYEQYINAQAKGDVNLYEKILQTEAPADLALLNLDYYVPIKRRSQNVEDNVFLQDFYLNLNNIPWSELSYSYDKILVKSKDRMEPNQFDFIDEDMTRIWFYEELMPKFVFVK